MKLYAGIDLHSTISYLAIIDGSVKRVFKEKATERHCFDYREANFVQRLP